MSYLVRIYFDRTFQVNYHGCLQFDKKTVTKVGTWYHRRWRLVRALRVASYVMRPRDPIIALDRPFLLLMPESISRPFTFL